MDYSRYYRLHDSPVRFDGSYVIREDTAPDNDMILLTRNGINRLHGREDEDKDDSM